MLSHKAERFILISMFLVAIVFIVAGFSVEAKNDQKKGLTTIPAAYRQFSITANAYSSPQH